LREPADEKLKCVAADRAGFNTEVTECTESWDENDIDCG
jgi:hypothetical protein